MLGVGREQQRQEGLTSPSWDLHLELPEARGRWGNFFFQGSQMGPRELVAKHCKADCP